MTACRTNRYDLTACLCRGSRCKIPCTVAVSNTYLVCPFKSCCACKRNVVEVKTVSNSVTKSFSLFKYYLIFTLNKVNENNLKLISIFAVLVIMLSSMAMLAMSTYYGKQQAKNWSVKKVFGCSREEVFWSMAWGFIKVVGIAAIIAVPVGYIVIQRWLSGYSYRIDNYWWIYALAIIFILLAAVITISWQAVKLMNSNPIKELKKE